MMPSKRRSHPSTKYLGGRLDESEPGSRGKILKNLLAIKTIREMEDAELLDYMEAERRLLGHFGPQHTFSIEDLTQVRQLQTIFSHSIVEVGQCNGAQPIIRQRAV